MMAEKLFTSLKKSGLENQFPSKGLNVGRAFVGLKKGKGRMCPTNQHSAHTFVKDSPPRQGSYKEMSGESKGVIG